MNKTKKLLQDCVGIAGYEKLEKSIFRRRSQSVADPLELYLPLLVVPRAILSWLVQNIQTLKVGEHKELKVPGQDDVTLNIRKEDTDVYRGEFTGHGSVIHTFEKQSLPSIAGHMMTVFEEYSHLIEPQGGAPDVPKSIELKEPVDTCFKCGKKGSECSCPKADMGIVKEIISLNDLSKQGPGEEAQKWICSTQNVKELTGVIGKLVDALVSKHIGYQHTVEVLDAAVGKKEMKESDPQKIESTKSDILTITKPSQKEAKPDTLPPGKHLAPICEAHSKPEIQKEAVRKDAPKESRPQDLSSPAKISLNRWFRMSRKAKLAAATRKEPTKEQAAASMDAAVKALEAHKAKKAELLEKPYVSDAQRRWAHTDTGTKALGGKAHVHEWDEATKGKSLPEKVSKAAMAVEKPAGVAAPKLPTPAKVPVTPKTTGTVPQAPHTGQVAKPPSVGTTQPKPQTSAMAKKAEPSENATTYLRGKLAKVRKAGQSAMVTKSEIYSPCPHCGVSEFVPTPSGPRFKPCYCFAILGKNDSGTTVPFVEIIRKGETFQLNFSKSADPESVHAFLVNLKSRLLSRKGE